MILGTSIDEHYWSRRTLTDKGDWNEDCSLDWIEGYWNSQTHSHRSPLLAAIEKYNPGSILEIGCNCGPNLYLLAKKFPHATIVGIDINQAAIEKGREFFQRENISNVTLQMGKADNLEIFSDEQFDVVFTDAVLIYIAPDKILDVLKGILRVTRKASILLEWHDDSMDGKGVFSGHWVRNYRELIKKISPGHRMTTTKITESDWLDAKWIQYGYIIEIS